MDNIYVPDTQKWIHYYQNLGENGHNPYVNYIHRGKKQIGDGSLSGTLRQFITHVGPSHKTEHDDKVTVKLVSPVQQIIDQAKYEVERENMKQGIKRKRSKQSVSPTAKRRRKHTRKVKKTSKNQRVKRLKKTVKKTSNKQVKNKKHIKIKNKSTTLKKTQLIKDIFDKSDGCFNK